MSSFFERNKKKGILGALLFLFQRKKGTGVVLLMVFLFTVPFILPADVLDRLPFAAHVKNWLGSDYLESSKSFREALKKARLEKKGESAWERFLRGSFGGAEEVSSINFVRAGKFGGEPKSLARPKSVQGIVSQGEAQQMEEGVSVDAGGLLASAFAAGGLSQMGSMGYTYPGNIFRGPVGVAPRGPGLEETPGLEGGSAPVSPVGKSTGFKWSKKAASSRSNLKMARMGKRVTQQLSTVKGVAVGLNRAEYPREWQVLGRAPYYGEAVPSNLIGVGEGIGVGLTSPNLDTLSVDVVGQCADKVKACDNGSQALFSEYSSLEKQVQSIANQLPNACDDPCNCGPCRRLLNQMSNICNGPLKDTVSKMGQACSLPPACSPGGPPAQKVDDMKVCDDSGKGRCGCKNIFCAAWCIVS
ncbi:MAG: hypothetical protein HY400_03925 [Elusimicrobia bacterium]|nr:hypothetical protein [Elusimicrobiota bacterium]